MSDNDEVKDPEQQEPVEPEDPRTTIKQEQIVEALSLIQRTAGKPRFDF